MCTAVCWQPEAFDAHADQSSGAPARARAPHRRKHDGEPHHSGRHQPARDAGEGDRRESPGYQSASIAQRTSKVSYTHLVAWAIVRALEKVPALNQAYSENGEGSFRITRDRREPGARGGRRGQGWLAIAQGSVGQERAGDEFRASSWPRMTIWWHARARTS